MPTDLYKAIREDVLKPYNYVDAIAARGIIVLGLTAWLVSILAFSHHPQQVRFISNTHSDSVHQAFQ